ncbi:hypothetical protein AB8O64_02900 [Streptomyces sp. QH1-20]|uniref:hypothetical protein n=1 Tax=Streptomyces sp. QH1-20 TaxID=3240934 RepID=UPI003519B7E1
MADRVKSTEQERLERLRAQLTGTGEPDRLVRALESGPYGNVLIGALLHGADRLRQGRTPTDLERLLLDAVAPAIPEAEIREWGRVYREVVTAQGRAALVPEVITGRSVAEGYAVADLRRDFSHVVDEALAAPNVRVVDAFEASEEGADSEAFIAVCKERKLGITAFAPPAEPMAAAPAAQEHTPDGAGADPGVAASFRVKLVLDSFKVERAVGDQGGGKDEIYWTAAAAGQGAYRSEEFGAMKKGQTRHFDIYNNILYDAPMGQFVGVSIQCWEADQSTSEWDKALVKALREAAASLETLLLIDSFLGVLPVWVGMSFEIGKMFLLIAEKLRNYDDLSAERSILMDLNQLAKMHHSDSPRHSFSFDGDGRHTLKIRSEGDRPTWPVGTIEITRFPLGDHENGTMDAIPVPLGWRSESAPCLVAHGDTLYAFFSRPDDQHLMFSHLQGPTWTEPVPVGDFHTVRQPSAAVYNGTLRCAFSDLDDDGAVVISDYDGTTWGPRQKTGGKSWLYGPGLSPDGSAVAFCEGKLGLSGDDWPYTIANGHEATSGPAVFVHEGKLKVAYRISTFPTVILDTVEPGLFDHKPRWKNDMHGPGLWNGDTDHGPAAAEGGGRVYVAIRDTEGKLQVNSALANERYWWMFIWLGWDTIRTMDEPSLAALGNRMYVMYRRAEPA